jgi:hypothetical protein
MSVPVPHATGAYAHPVRVPAAGGAGVGPVAGLGEGRNVGVTVVGSAVVGVTVVGTLVIGAAVVGVTVVGAYVVGAAVAAAPNKHAVGGRAGLCRLPSLYKQACARTVS